MDNNTSERVNSSESNGRDDMGRGVPHRRVVAGLVTGTFIGVGIGLWLAPHVSTLRQRLGDSARELATRAAERYEQAGSRTAAAVDAIADSAQNVRDGLADGVAQGAHKVERIAIAIKS